MKRTVSVILTAVFAILIYSSTAQAEPDQFVGDNSIYTGSEVDVQPNVLIIFDTSGSMGETVSGGNYSSSRTYDGSGNYCGGAACVKGSAYKCTSFSTQCDSWVFVDTIATRISKLCNSVNPRSILTGNTGQITSTTYGLGPNNQCIKPGSGTYANGNWINWSHTVGPPQSKLVVAKDVVTDLINGTSGVSFGLMRFDTTDGGRFVNSTVNGASYTSTIKNMSGLLSGATVKTLNRTALLKQVATLTLNRYTPLAETLYEAGLYFRGQAPKFGKDITGTLIPGTTDVSGKYISPIVAGCQQNYIVFITDGMSTEDLDPVLKTICTNGDCNNDGHEPYGDPYKHASIGNPYGLNGSDYMDDVAKYLRDTDMATGINGVQNVTTYTIGFGLSTSNPAAVRLLDETTSSGTGGATAHSYLADSAQGLSLALQAIFGTIASVNSSYVAPVVPVSPDNRSYSGSRVYLGFFKPENRKPWSGNLKKFGFDNNNNLVDKNGTLASTSDGSILSTVTSYWTTTADGSEVTLGGAGEKLRARTLSTRVIYTYKSGGLPVDLSLTDATRFNTTNISAADLGVGSDAERDKVVNFTYGYDAYSATPTGTRSWIMGDILHSKPAIINYQAYAAANEGVCTANKTMIYVGANDGMLHAFKDCDGSEAWAFIPPDLLTTLQYFDGVTHTYYVDSSPSTYIYDANGNRSIDSGDKVILVVGLRRGGGEIGVKSTGAYYALDVTDPAKPRYMWTINSDTTDFSEMGETFSEPMIVKTKLSTGNKMVMFVGAGYDSCNEDGRFGAIQTYPGLCNTLLTTADDGDVTSTGASAQITPTGRGIFAIEIAALDSTGAPSFTNSGTKIWKMTNFENPNMTFPFISALSPIDKNFDGYVDRIYAGDAGGNLWKFDVSNTATTSWSAQKMFSSNPGAGGSGDTGRKIFYQPSVTIESDGVWVFFGTGDREHPLNRAVTDRMYAFADRGQTTTKTEANLVDVTLDTLQAGTNEAAVTSVVSSLTDTVNKFGWYVQLNENDGEKVLAAPSVQNRIVYYTTYSPNLTASTDACAGGNLGTGRLYVMNYKTGEAIINFDTTNDSASSSLSWNSRATPADNTVLLRSDRVKKLRAGIPSGVVPVTSASGDKTIMVGVGGGILGAVGGLSGSISIYWRTK